MLGRTCLLLGRLDEARRLADRALESSPHQPGFAPHVRHLLGDIATHPDRFDAESGEAHYREALALAEPRGMRPLVAHCHLGLGRLSRRTGKREQAHEHLTTAAAMYREMGMGFWLEQAGGGVDGARRVTCPQCAFENPPAMAFCGRCGARLASLCPSCGFVNPEGFAFCGKCGARVVEAPAPALQDSPAFASPGSYTPKHLAEKILTSKAALEGERKQVTVLFADLKGSMELLADRDPEEARKLLDPVLERMMEAVHRYEGTVNQVMGDGIMALFGAPLAHEDHAVRACYAALRMQEVVRRYSDELRRAQGVEVQIRVGLNSGDVVVRSIGSDLRMDYTAVGQTTHLAARMEQLAAPGSIRLTAETLHLAEGFVQVTPLGPVPIKGLGEPVEVFELVGAGAARTRLEAAARRGLTRFVGRTAELEQLRDALDRASLGHGQVVAVVGEPGVGKSRLFWELTHSHRVHGWLIVQSASVSYGKATAYLPVIELLRGYFAIESRDDPRKIREKVTGKVLTLAPALAPAVPALLALLDVPVDEASWHALDPLQRRQQTLDAVKRLLLRESEVQPLVVVFEDLHWIDGETQSLARQPRREPARGAPPAPRQLPPRVPARLGRQDLLPPAPDRSPAARERGRAARGAPRP